MRFQSYFNTALVLIQGYDGSVPLAAYLKQYFAQHKKHGSKDRKYISHLCYCYFRLGHALQNIPVEGRLKIALFVCTDDIAGWTILFEEEWMNNHTALLRKRVAFMQTRYPLELTDIFPWHEELSDGIDVNVFALSHLVQPYLFLRTRPGKKSLVIQKLQQAGITFEEPRGNAITLPNATKVDAVIELNKEAVVQDYSSQQVQHFFSIIQPKAAQPITVWDCCAASGGKSILAFDSFKKMELTVSDIRQSIINNLQQRFNEAGIKEYKKFVADISSIQNLQSAIGNMQYALVVCDAPCTGSGTWARTPEQLFFFTEEKINHYSALQQKIVANVIPHIKKDGYLLYITCSVFRQENENRVAEMLQSGLTLIEEKLIEGYTNRADTMFAALFKK